MITRSLSSFGTVLALCTFTSGATALGAWQVQEWRYGRELDRQAQLHTAELGELTIAGAAAQRRGQNKRLALEQRLQASNQTHYSELLNAQKNQKRLRDRLATTELRLSVLLTATDTGGSTMPAASSTGRMVHGTHRAELDPTHAQRIIGITDDGDRGLIALQACQAFARRVSDTL